jgi:hypothetical protein
MLNLNGDDVSIGFSMGEYTPLSAWLFDSLPPLEVPCSAFSPKLVWAQFGSAWAG